MDLLLENVVLSFYPAGTSLMLCGSKPDSFHIVIKGVVKAEDEHGEILRIYREKDSFDADSLLSGNCAASYIVEEDLICYELKGEFFLELFEKCESLKSFYLMDMVERLEYLKRREREGGSGEWITARVAESYWHSPCLVPADTTLGEAVKLSAQMGRSEIITRDRNGDYGIIADSDIKKMIAEGKLDLESSVSSVAKYPLITVEKEDFLFNAYLTLIRENIKRLGVVSEGVLEGVLEQIDILSYFANHSHLITVKIEHAATLEELKDASQGYLTVVRRLYSQGLKVRYISKLISEVNRKVYRKLFEMVVPSKYHDRCVLLVMGSEGRGEQIVRTDQDNAVIVDESVDMDEFAGYMESFTSAMIDFGYPECPGEVMVSNPYWRMNQSEYRERIDRWLSGPDERSFMELAIFFDADAVFGNTHMMRDLRSYIFERLDRSDDVYMAYFARLTLLFETPVGLWSSLLHKDRHIDIKKAGIFPIVQGTRSMALKYGIEKLSTVERIKECVGRGLMDEALARELVEAFDALVFLRLGAQLGSLEKGAEPDNTVHSEDLSKIQRDLLMDSLEIVERFKKFISRYFDLDKLPS